MLCKKLSIREKVFEKLQGKKRIQQHKKNIKGLLEMKEKCLFDSLLVVGVMQIF